MNGHLGGGGDEEVPFAVTESLVTEGDLAIPPPRQAEAARQARNGKYYAAFGIGQSVAAVPFYLLGRGVATHLGLPAEQQRPWIILFVTLLNPVVVATSCALFYDWLRRLAYNSNIALATTLCYGLGTLVWPYARSFLSEPLSGLCLLIAAYALHRSVSSPSSARSWGWAGGSGLAAGYAILVRPFMGLVVPLLLVYLWLRQSKRELRPAPARSQAEGPSRQWKGGALSSVRLHLPQLIGLGGAFLLPVVAATAFTLGWNFYRYGQWFEFGYGPEVTGAFTLNLLPGLLGNLLSPGKSLFLYMPIVLVGLWGLRDFFRDHPEEAGLCVAILIEALLFYSARIVWWGNWCWGPRYFVPVTAFFLLPLAAALSHRRTKLFRLAFAGLLTVSVLVQLLGVLVYNGLYISLALKFADWPALLYQPAYSPLVGHWMLFLRGYLNPLVCRLWQTVSPGAALTFAALPLLLLASGARWIFAPPAPTPARVQ